MSFSKQYVVDLCNKYGLNVDIFPSKGVGDYCLIMIYDEADEDGDYGLSCEFIGNTDDDACREAVNAFMILDFGLEKQQCKINKLEEELEYYKSIALDGKPENKKRRM